MITRTRRKLLWYFTTALQLTQTDAQVSVDFLRLSIGRKHSNGGIRSEKYRNHFVANCREGEFLSTSAVQINLTCTIQYDSLV